MRLFNYRWPKAGICQEQELYYRIASYGEGGACASAEGIPRGGIALHITKGAVVSFDTYFNCFSYAKYREYTWVNKTTAVLILKGSALVRLIAVREQNNGDISREILGEQEIHTQGFAEVRLDYDFSSDTSHGYYYTEITGFEDVYCSGGFWEAAECSTASRVKIAVVICTYKREFFLYRNMAMVERDILGFEGPESIKDSVGFFIVDNGKTIPPDRWSGEKIQVFPNKNYGGSGGFTRGIIEAYRRRDEFTHFLLMDDDIIFDAETLVKTVRFLAVLRPEHNDLCLGGSMLRLDIPFLQYEAGGHWNGLKVENVKHGLDLRRWESVMANEIKDAHIDFQAWWYICMPLLTVDDYGLPLPFFINSDDIEYGIRAIKKLEILNGIGVWHQFWNCKYSMSLMYYMQRNQIIVNILHRSRIGLFRQWFYLAYFVLHQLIIQRYTAAELVFQAARDFLKGPDFFLNTNEEELHKALTAQLTKNYTDEELKKQGVVFNRIKYMISQKRQGSRSTAILVLLQLFFLPRFFYKKDFIVVDISGYKFTDFSRAQKVLHYNTYERSGFITEISKRKIWALILKLLAVLIKMLFRYPGLARAYRERIDELTGFDFWCKHLGIGNIGTKSPIHTSEF
jgi:GT2 family glycosyltransferase